jgi:putative DNA primase/helicase
MARPSEAWGKGNADEYPLGDAHEGPLGPEPPPRPGMKGPPNGANVQDDVQEARPPAFSDIALALRFADKHANDLRFVAAWSRWFEWDGVRWHQDDTLRAFDLARAVCQAASSECNKPRLAGVIAGAKTVAAVERLAKADRRHAATIAEWDADVWLLNTPGGTIDLHSGIMRPHRREDFCTKTTAVAPGGDCPLWRQFLERITAGDAELQGFLQRMAGYALTGSTQEHALFFGHGTGANGKGVFVGTIQGVMGDYATTAPMETFIASTSDRHPTELAGLRGARLVTAQETEEGRRWAESKIKALTGGDRVSARFMRQDFFEFVPQFKLLIMGNHKPGLRGVDEAIRRRMNLIPFTVTIPAEERDEKLPAKLRGEWPGILRWMIAGCAAWQSRGLAQPEAVRAATEAYLAAEDALAQWMAERCAISLQRFATTAELFGDWVKWADTAGEFAGSQKRFSQALLNRGFVSDRQAGTGKMGFRGIGLKPGLV